METQKITNLLGSSEELNSKFATIKWYIINDQNNGQYTTGDENGTIIKFETKVIKPNLCDYSDGYGLVTGNITAAGGSANTKVALKNCGVFRRCVTHINDEYIETAEHLDVAMNMYNLLRYSDNYADSSGSLWQFKRDKLNVNTNADITVDNSISLKYKSSYLGTPTAAGALNGVKIAIPLKYVSNFFSIA